MEGIEKAVPSVELTEKLLRLFKEAVESKKLNDETRKEIKDHLCENVGSAVPFRIVRSVFLALKDEGKNIYLHEMLSESDLVLPGVKFPPRDPELEARIQKLKAEEANHEYRKMTQNIDISRREEITFREDVKSLNRQLIAVFNFLVTVGGAFAFGYKGVEVAFGSKMFPMQMASGLLLGTVVFFADLYFLVKLNPS